MMKLLAVILLLLGTVTRGSTQEPEDVAGFLQNPELVRRQLNCVTNQGPCDATGEFIKTAVIPEVIGRNCGSCTPQQRAVAGQAAQYLRTNYPQEWQTINSLYGG